MDAEKGGLWSLFAAVAGEMKGWTANNYQTVNMQINLLAGVIDGASALDQYHIVIFIAATVPYIVSHAANPQMISLLRCQLLNICPHLVKLSLVLH